MKTILIAAAFMFVMQVATANDAFVQMIERREGVFPGKTKVLPECNCTIKYLGTKVRGNIYTVILQKMD